MNFCFPGLPVGTIPRNRITKFGFYQVVKTVAIAICVYGLCAMSLPTAAQEVPDWPDEFQCREDPPTDAVRAGWCLSIDRNRGNCVACHMLNVDPWPETLPIAGNIAPPLVAMQARFADLEALRLQIADAPALNPDTSMPPYLRHELLDADDIDRILQFLLTL